MIPILRPCPFCGNKAELHQGHRCVAHGEYPMIAYIQCTFCNASSDELIIDGFYGYTTTVQDVADLWNKRTIL